MTWTLGDVIVDLEAEGALQPPFSVEERELAHKVAAAWFFIDRFDNIPDRVADGSFGHAAMTFGIERVLARRRQQEGSWRPVRYV
jgi:hypothetical protein